MSDASSSATGICLQGAAYPNYRASIRDSTLQWVRPIHGAFKAVTLSFVNSWNGMDIKAADNSAVPYAPEEWNRSDSEHGLGNWVLFGPNVSLGGND